jgi:hypothetical protein
MITATIQLTPEQIEFLRGTIYEYANNTQFDVYGNKIEMTPEETIIYNELENILEIAEDTITRLY